MKLGIKIRESEAKERLVLSAFIGYQLGAGGEVTWKQYLESMGLWEGQQAEPSSKELEMSAEAAIAKSESILKIAREKQADG